MARPMPSILLLLGLWLLLPGTGAAADEPFAQINWRSQGADGTVQVHLHFFWSRNCPHCQEARRYLAELGPQHAWLQVHEHEISQSREALRLYQALAAALGEEARSVPAFFICARMYVGWQDAAHTGQALLQGARACRAGADSRPDPASAGGTTGAMGFEGLSLPVLTLVLASLDAFNPCAFFVLLFLLSLLIHARSRRRMLLIGSTFVLVSGLTYFLFMAAWLKLFLLTGSLPYITVAAGLLALLIGLLNSKDFFYFKQGPSLSIPDSAKPGLFARMRALLSSDSLPTLMLGTVSLAIAVNGYELLCTAGFPMVYTRALTLQRLEGLHYYLYLALYNLIYILPLLAIVLLFTLTLGAKKLSTREGRLLKLISGFMMLSLGLLLILAPQLLNQVGTAIGLLAASIMVGWLGWWWQRGHGGA